MNIWKREGCVIKNKFDVLYKGLLIGSTMLVPGVSGGSMAMILGIYDRLLEAVSDFLKEKKKNFLFLLLFVIGAGMGMLLLAKPISSLLETYPKAMGFLFIGAVAGGIPAIYGQAGIRSFSWKYILYILVGMVIVGMLSFLNPEGMGQNAELRSDSVIFLLAAGGIAAAALILPGISVSYLLLVMGLYQELMRAISEFDVKFLLPIGIGIFVGVILMTKGLRFVMTKYPQISYLTILGFVIGSLAEVFPGIPVGQEWVFCLPAAAFGFYFIFFLSETEK